MVVSPLQLSSHCQGDRCHEGLFLNGVLSWAGCHSAGIRAEGHALGGVARRSGGNPFPRFHAPGL
eukprot:958458-Karenia_brevis.AAC.1